MATATVPRTDRQGIHVPLEGLDRNKREVRGEVRAPSETVVTNNLRRQGIRVTKIKRQTLRGGRSISQKDITFFTRQLATMLKAGVPHAAGVRHRRPRPQQRAVLAADDADQEQDRDRLEPVAGVPRAPRAFRRPLLQPGARRRDRRARSTRSSTGSRSYMEKILAIKSKIKSALFYPISVIVVAIVVVWVIMVWVIPAFKQVFTSFGADLPGADADGDRDLRFRRRLVVAGLPRHRRQRSSGCCSLYRRSAAFRFALRPAAAASSRSSAAIVAEGDDRALDAHAGDDVRRRRAAGRIARRRRRRRRATPSTRPRPSGSRPTSAPARASPTR